MYRTREHSQTCKPDYVAVGSLDMPPLPVPFISISGGNPPENSQYTYKHLHALRQGSPAGPLRVIAHIDLDAFYAQCEMKRLGTPCTTPLAVQQWGSLIAVNYPARSFGITRMISAKQAKELCPEIVLQHVATFREGEGGKWAYREDAHESISSDKVSLDPYRAESRKILAVVESELGRWYTDLASNHDIRAHVRPASFEKASIDEAFIDLSPLAFGVLLERYPELRGSSAIDDKVTMLPHSPTTALERNPEDYLVDLGNSEAESDDPDWDDITMLIGSEIVRSIRGTIYEKLGYTCSAGIARNKMIAKLGSSTNKPDKQTVIRNRAVQNFLGTFKFTKIRMLGGKLGGQVAAAFGTELVSELLQVPIDQFRTKLDDDTATWLYGIIRGEDRSEVNPRTQTKSMLSVKSFRPGISSDEQADKWLRIFAADISNRLADECKRRPKIITLHYRQDSQTRSRQIPVPSSKPLNESFLYELGVTLLRQAMADGRSIWPCSTLSLSVGAFEENVTRNWAIDCFLATTEQSKRLPSLCETNIQSISRQPDSKRKKLENNGIQRFFAKQSMSLPHLKTPVALEGPEGTQVQLEEDGDDAIRVDSTPLVHGSETSLSPTGFYLCLRCNELYPNEAKLEHDDWHFARDLDCEGKESLSARPTFQQVLRLPPNRNRAGVKSRAKAEKGQTRLQFS